MNIEADKKLYWFLTPTHTHTQDTPVLLHMHTHKQKHCKDQDNTMI